MQIYRIYMTLYKYAVLYTILYMIKAYSTGQAEQKCHRMSDWVCDLPGSNEATASKQIR